MAKSNNDTEFKGHMFSAGVGAGTSLAAYRLWEKYQNGNVKLTEDETTVETPDDIDTLGAANLAQDSYSDAIEMNPADTIHGKEAQEIPFDPEVYQFYPDTCAIQSQHLILKEFGIDVTQNELIEVAKINGWYMEGHGTPMIFTGKLLEYYGVDVHATYGNNIFNLANELAQGHRVIVAVDSGELVNPEKEIGEDEIYGEHSDHALVVVGIDTTDPDDVRIIVTDPGTGNRQWSYSEKEFMDAWKDSDCTMVSTDVSPQEYQHIEFTPLDEFADIPIGDLAQIADVGLSASYDFFTEFFNSIMDNPEGWLNVIAEYPNLFYADDSGVVHFIEPSTENDIPLMEI